ncbi:hypothetical protein K458DRAFT_296874 [Lentithecium fluviatile CBS 122367]|uniref:Alpha/beta-hydrolase n=1 Tax=Lentithecium fluviatile CBS 122367 TaxID=1168545 RepID=A0A6G1JA18_9PLEO|nr:hypothetical protein K458DRAFT_296874 [Lentithecium fluviatile CBS 122367]
MAAPEATTDIDDATEAAIIEYLCDRRFHQSFTLPPNPAIGRKKPYRVSFADYGDANSKAVVLFCGAFGTARFDYWHLDLAAKRYKVRIVCPDRPGIGGSDPVDLHKRIDMWLEIVPQLLAHLNISHISLAGYSGGVVYALSTMLTYPNLLHPTKPHACLFSPWVHQSHTDISALHAANFVPSMLISKCKSEDPTAFCDKNISRLEKTAVVIKHAKQALRNKKPKPVLPVPPVPPVQPATHTEPKPEPQSNPEGLLGRDMKDHRITSKIRKLATSYLLAERIDGISADAQLFLKRPGTISWSSPRGIWSDLDDFVPLLMKVIEREKDAEESRYWMIHVSYAKNDDMVGEKGRIWFDSCWLRSSPRPGDMSDAETREWEKSQSSWYYLYGTEVVPNASHNNLMRYCGRSWLKAVRQAMCD